MHICVAHGKGSRRSTNYVAQATAENAAQTAIQLGIKSVEVEIKGLGYGKEQIKPHMWSRWAMTKSPHQVKVTV